MHDGIVKLGKQRRGHDWVGIGIGWGLKAATERNMEVLDDGMMECTQNFQKPEKKTNFVLSHLPPAFWF